MDSTTLKNILDSIAASTRIEDFVAASETKILCKHILQNEISMEQAVAMLNEKIRSDM